MTSRDEFLIDQEKQAYLARAQWHQEQLKAMAEVSARIPAVGTPEATLQEIADQARGIVGAHWAAVQTVSYGLWPHTSVALSLSEECLQGSALAISMAAAAISTESFGPAYRCGFQPGHGHQNQTDRAGRSLQHRLGRSWVCWPCRSSGHRVAARWERSCCPAKSAEVYT